MKIVKKDGISHYFFCTIKRLMLDLNKGGWLFD